MIKLNKAFSGFSVDDFAKAKKFYGETLGVDVSEHEMGLTLKIGGTNGIFVYQKDNHEPATFTILNFPVDDVEKAMEELKAKGVTFEVYEGMTDENGLAKMGGAPEMIAWFKDPAGNILSILKDE